MKRMAMFLFPLALFIMNSCLSGPSLYIVSSSRIIDPDNSETRYHIDDEGRGFVIGPPYIEYYCGIMDNKGKIIISPDYDIRFIDRGMLIDSEGKWFCIDRSGNPIDFELDNVEILSSSDEGYIFTDTKGREGLFSDKGVFQFFLDENFEFFRPYNDGLAAVRDKRNRKFGYVDLNGNIVINCIYDITHMFHEGYAEVSQSGKRYYIDKKGHQQFNQDWKRISSFYNGVAAVFNGSRWGAINTSGELIIDYCYAFPFFFDEGLAIVQIPKDPQWNPDELNSEASENYYFYCIDKTGKVVIDFQQKGFDRCSGFSGGLAAVRRLDGKYIFIDRNGNQAIDGEYFYANYFDGDLALVHLSFDPRPDFTKPYPESKPVYINRKGEIVSRYFIDLDY